MTDNITTPHVHYKYSSLFDTPAKSENVARPLTKPHGASFTGSSRSLPSFSSSSPLPSMPSSTTSFDSAHTEPRPPAGTYINGRTSAAPSGPAHPIPTTFAKRSPVRRRPIGIASAKDDILTPSVSPPPPPPPAVSPPPVPAIPTLESPTLPVNGLPSFTPSSNGGLLSSTKPLSLPTSKGSSSSIQPLSLPATQSPTAHEERMLPLSSTLTNASESEITSKIESLYLNKPSSTGVSNPEEPKLPPSVEAQQSTIIGNGGVKSTGMKDQDILPTKNDQYPLSYVDTKSVDPKIEASNLLKSPTMAGFKIPEILPSLNRPSSNEILSEEPAAYNRGNQPSDSTYNNRRSPSNRSPERDSTEFEFLDNDKTPTAELVNPHIWAGDNVMMKKTYSEQNSTSDNNILSPLSESSVYVEDGYDRHPDSSHFEPAASFEDNNYERHGTSAQADISRLVSESSDQKRESDSFDHLDIMDHYNSESSPAQAEFTKNSVPSNRTSLATEGSYNYAEQYDKEPIYETTEAGKRVSRNYSSSEGGYSSDEKDIEQRQSRPSQDNYNAVNNYRVEFLADEYDSNDTIDMKIDTSTDDHETYENDSHSNYAYYSEEFQPEPIDERPLVQEELYVVKPLYTGSSAGGYNSSRKNSAYSEVSMQSSTSTQSDNYYYEETTRQLGIVNTNGSDSTNNTYSDSINSSTNSLNRIKSAESLASRQNTRDSYRSLRSNNSTNTNASHPLYMKDFSGPTTSFEPEVTNAEVIVGHDNPNVSSPYSVATAHYPEIPQTTAVSDTNQMMSRVGSIKRQEARPTNVTHNNSNPGFSPPVIAASSASIVRANSSVTPSSRPKSVMSNASSKTQYGKGVQSAYIYTLRRKTATVWCDVSSKVWGLPIEISDAKNSYGKAKISKGAMDIRHSHLKPRLLDSEVSSPSVPGGGGLSSSSSIGKNDHRGGGVVGGGGAGGGAGGTMLEREGTISRYPMNNPKPIVPGFSLSELSISRTNDSASSSRRDSSSSTSWNTSSRNSGERIVSDLKPKNEPVKVPSSRPRSDSDSSVESIQDVSKIKLFVANPDM